MNGRPGPTGVGDRATAGDGNDSGEEEEADVTVSKSDQLRAEAKTLGHLMNH